MNNFISSRSASSALFIIFSLVILFHVLVIAGIIPYGIVWGGRIQSQEEMISFEIISILINGIMLAVVAIYTRHLNVKINPKIIKAALWIMVGIFLLNTIGNLFSKNEWEKIIFTPITLLLAIFSLRLAME
jgi:hydrogenase-4 membrane subunit HyfE